jgi:hypothetical protein
MTNPILGHLTRLLAQHLGLEQLGDTGQAKVALLQHHEAPPVDIRQPRGQRDVLLFREFIGILRRWHPPAWSL